MDQPTALAVTKTSGGRLRAILGHRAVWPLAALAVILIIDGIIAPDFFSIRIVQGRLFGSLIDVLYRGMPPALLAIFEAPFEVFIE